MSSATSPFQIMTSAFNVFIELLILQIQRPDRMRGQMIGPPQHPMSSSRLAWLTMFALQEHRSGEDWYQFSTSTCCVKIDCLQAIEASRIEWKGVRCHTWPLVETLPTPRALGEFTLAYLALYDTDHWVRAAFPASDWSSRLTGQEVWRRNSSRRRRGCSLYSRGWAQITRSQHSSYTGTPSFGDVSVTSLLVLTRRHSLSPKLLLP